MTSAPPETEPAWKTYVRCFLFLLPALVAWNFSSVFLYPKFEAIWQEAVTPRLQNSAVYAFYATSRSIFSIRPISASFLIIAFGALELLWKSWPRYRRAVVGTITFMIYTIVLFGVTAMSTALMIVIPLLLK